MDSRTLENLIQKFHKLSLWDQNRPANVDDVVALRDTCVVAGEWLVTAMRAGEVAPPAPIPFWLGFFLVPRCKERYLGFIDHGDVQWSYCYPWRPRFAGEWTRRPLRLGLARTMFGNQAAMDPSVGKGARDRERRSFVLRHVFVEAVATWLTARTGTTSQSVPVPRATIYPVTGAPREIVIDTCGSWQERGVNTWIPVFAQVAEQVLRSAFSTCSDSSSREVLEARPPNRETMSERMVQAYEALDRQRETQRKREHEARAIAARQRSLMQALDAAQHFVSYGDGTEPAGEFERSWAECWMEAAQAVRDHAGMTTTEGMVLPAEPALVVVQELFEEALSGVSHDRLSEQLSVTLDRLAGGTAGGSSDDHRMALREFFGYLKTWLLTHTPRLRAAAEPAPPGKGSSAAPRFALELARGQAGSIPSARRSAAVHRPRRRRAAIVPDGWLTATDAAGEYDIPRSTLQTWIEGKLLPASKKDPSSGVLLIEVCQLETLLQQKARLSGI